MTGVYRERKRAIFRAYVRELGFGEALDTYNVHAGIREKKCRACGAPVDEYSEWNETGYAHERCSNGCWSICTSSFTHDYSVRDFCEQVNTNLYYPERRTPKKEYNDILRRFEQVIEQECKRLKRLRDLTYRKKR